MVKGCDHCYINDNAHWNWYFRLWDVDFDLSERKYQEHYSQKDPLSGYASASEICGYSLLCTEPMWKSHQRQSYDGTGNLYVLVNYNGTFATRNIMYWKLEGEQNETDYWTFITGSAEFMRQGKYPVFQKRCQWRGIEAETISFWAEWYHWFFRIGYRALLGGSDREQMLSVKSLWESFRSFLRRMWKTTGVVIAICGGYQLLGKLL